MVENQHGLGSVLSFSAKSVNPEILEALLVGREKIVNQLENRVKNISNDGLNHQVLIIGARGTGKTHMLSVLHNRIQPQIKKGKIKVAYFAEEEYGISGYLDFMVRILNAFIRWNEQDADFLKSQLAILQETPNSQQEDTIERIIREYISGTPLLILAENFNDILDALKQQGQSKLRNWLQENNRISIIATSQALSDDIGKEDKPFYGFFDEINIKPLTLEESFQLLKALARIEKRNDVIKHLENKGKAQVKAINTLVKGNHRLLITFYEFLKSDVLSNLSIMFIKTLNDLKPYYETYIRYQPPQQQKIIRFLALAKNPQQGVDIAKECFIDPKSLSKQLSDLSKKKLVDTIVDPDDKRNKLYDISEPLLRISIEIGEHKEGISALFIDFLALYYDKNELKDQKAHFSNIFKDCLDPVEKRQYNFEILARDKAIKLQQQLQSKTISDEIRKKLIKTFNLLIDEGKFKDAIYVLEGVSDKIGVKNYQYYDLLLSLYILSKDYDKAIDTLYKSLEQNPIKEDLFKILNIILLSSKDYVWWQSILEKVIAYDIEDSRVFTVFGGVLIHNDAYNKAKKILIKSLKLNPKEELTKLLLILSYNFELPKKYFHLNYEVVLESKKLLKDFDVMDYEILSKIIISILKHDKNIQNEKFSILETFLTKEFKDIIELKISIEFVKTFRQIVLENNPKAIYNLPKERREFFQKEILDFRNKRNDSKPNKKSASTN